MYVSIASTAVSDVSTIILQCKTPFNIEVLRMLQHALCCMDVNDIVMSHLHSIVLVSPHPKACGCHQMFKAYVDMIAVSEACNVLSQAIRCLKTQSCSKWLLQHHWLDQTAMFTHITHASVLTGLKLCDHTSCPAFLLKRCQSPRLGAWVQKMHRAQVKAHGTDHPRLHHGLVLWPPAHCRRRPAHYARFHDETPSSYSSAAHSGVSVYPTCS